MNSHEFYNNPFQMLASMTESAINAINSCQDEIGSFDDDSLFHIMSVPNSVDKCICSNNFPPSNIYTKDGKYCIDFAVAGYTEDDISVSYKDNYITVKLTAPEHDMTGVVPLKQGIRMRGVDTVDVFIDSQKYNVKNISVSLTNGILSIVVGQNKDFVKSYSIGINGNPPKKIAVNNAATEKKIEDKEETDDSESSDEKSEK